MADHSSRYRYPSPRPSDASLSGQPGHSCETCSHWQPGLSSTRGTCRHSSPRTQVVLIASEELEVQAIWPSTAAGDWCGAWLSPEDRQRRLSRPIVPLTSRPAGVLAGSEGG